MYIYVYTHTYIYIYTPTYTPMSVYMCLCECAVLRIWFGLQGRRALVQVLVLLKVLRAFVLLVFCLRAQGVG